MSDTNTYRVAFTARCPNNGVPIRYTLTITTEARIAIPVERIVCLTEVIERGYHEGIADRLHDELGGRHVLVAHHHGVDIQTIRGNGGTHDSDSGTNNDRQ